LVDGLWLLRKPALRRLFDYSIYMLCPAETARSRRLKRDQLERGRSNAHILEQFETHVLPMQRRYVDSQSKRATVVLKSPPSPGELRHLKMALRSLVKEEQKQP